MSQYSGFFKATSMAVPRINGELIPEGWTQLTNSNQASLLSLSLQCKQGTFEFEIKGGKRLKSSNQKMVPLSPAAGYPCFGLLTVFRCGQPHSVLLAFSSWLFYITNIFKEIHLFLGL